MSQAGELSQDTEAVTYRQHTMGFSLIKPAPEELIFWENIKNYWTTIPPQTPTLSVHLSAASRFMLLYTKHIPLGGCQTCLLPASSACWPSLKTLIKHIKCLASWRLEDLPPSGGEQVCR